jgi:hypothetical protein
LAPARATLCAVGELNQGRQGFDRIRPTHADDSERGSRAPDLPLRA